MDTRIGICCAAKPGLLLSTVHTIEALGLEIQQCVISCFNDFSMHASCSEVCIYIALVSASHYYYPLCFLMRICQYMTVLGS